MPQGPPSPPPGAGPGRPTRPPPPPPGPPAPTWAAAPPDWGQPPSWHVAPTRRRWVLPTVLGGGAVLFVIAVAVVVVVIGRSGPGEWVLTVGPSGDLTEVTLPVGACADVEPWTARRLDDASVVPCDDPHELEVIARDQLAGPSSVLGARSPRAFGVIDVAERWCLTSFELYVDALYEESIFDYLTLLPDERRWRDGDREVICLAVPFRDEDLLGSVRESRR